MITYIQGKLVAATPLQAVIDVAGLGYEVHVPVTTAEKLPPSGNDTKLHTHVVYREDSQAIFGFATREERDFFRLLVEKVSGVGPRVAISIMSKLSLPVLQTAISSGDVALLAKCPGIGKKTAERLVIELKDKIGVPGGSPTGAPSTADGSAPAPTTAENAVENRVQDAVMALVTLGYKLADADKGVRKALASLGDEATSEELIKAAFR